MLEMNISSKVTPLNPINVIWTVRRLNENLPQSSKVGPLDNNFDVHCSRVSPNEGTILVFSDVAFRAANGKAIYGFHMMSNGSLVVAGASQEQGSPLQRRPKRGRSSLQLEGRSSKVSRTFV
eukprot:TRINITY_DN6174_c0_g1_i3.p2 TRINITY_DN6174_c0_g1~~TRINITY_DN6174_c0_g1_i3.p2  ORF type:complete len:122 (+),score=21.99 TRINITY_DN6174_c0_g1_i3:1772-2137(+)